MVEAMRRIDRYTRDLTLETFAANEMAIAVVRSPTPNTRLDHWARHAGRDSLSLMYGHCWQYAGRRAILPARMATAFGLIWAALLIANSRVPTIGAAGGGRSWSCCQACSS